MAKKIKHILIGLIALVFILFYCIGFDMPWSRNPEFSEPLFTNIVLWLVVVVLIAAFAVAVISVIATNKHRHSAINRNDDHRGLRIGGLVALLTVVMLISAFVSGTDALMVNGKTCEDALTLRMAGMFVLTIVIMLILAIAITVASMVRKKK
ncbi:MAG: hypothetical protein KBS94_00070 [Prevotella sp.]|nr:hypothetical protein [Candidatus Equicola faecalis]